MIVLNYTELNKLHGVMRSKKERKEKEHFEQKTEITRVVFLCCVLLKNIYLKVLNY